MLLVFLCFPLVSSSKVASVIKFALSFCHFLTCDVKSEKEWVKEVPFVFETEVYGYHLDLNML